MAILLRLILVLCAAAAGPGHSSLPSATASADDVYVVVLCSGAVARIGLDGGVLPAGDGGEDGASGHDCGMCKIAKALPPESRPHRVETPLLPAPSPMSQRSREGRCFQPAARGPPWRATA